MPLKAENMNDYHLVRYKDGCHQWHHHKVIKDFLKIYEEYMSITHFDYVNFKLENIRLQTFLAHYDINACILGLTCYAPMPQDMDISIPYFKDRIYWNKEIGDAEKEIVELYKNYSAPYFPFAWLHSSLINDFEKAEKINLDPVTTILKAFLKIEKILLRFKMSNKKEA